MYRKITHNIVEEHFEEVEEVNSDNEPLPPNVQPIHGPVPPEDVPELGLPSRLIS